MSYNAAGVLAHIASDGPEMWTIDKPTREEVLVKMSSAIDRWNLTVERNINYRSFEPIIGLVRCYETPECQHWAVWALANLTKVNNLFSNNFFTFVDEKMFDSKKKKNFFRCIQLNIVVWLKKSMDLAF